MSKWFDTSAYDEKLKRPLPIRLNKKVLGTFEDELNGYIMVKHCSPKAKTHAHLLGNGEEIKKEKGTGKVVTKKNITFENFGRCVLGKETIRRKELRFKNSCHKVTTNEENRIVMSPGDDKRLQTFDGITTYQYGTPAVKVCESQMLSPKNVHRILRDR